MTINADTMTVDALTEGIDAGKVTISTDTGSVSTDTTTTNADTGTINALPPTTDAVRFSRNPALIISVLGKVHPRNRQNGGSSGENCQLSGPGKAHSSLN